MSTDDFFRARLDPLFDKRHPLAALATRMPRAQLEDGRCHKRLGEYCRPDVEDELRDVQLAHAGQG